MHTCEYTKEIIPDGEYSIFLLCLLANNLLSDYASWLDKRHYIQACHVLWDHGGFCVENKSGKKNPP